MQENGSKPSQPDAGEPTTHTPKTLTPTDNNRLFFLSRFTRLNNLKNTISNPTPPEQTLLHKGIFSTYSDCINLGVGDQARSIMEGKATKYLGIVVFEPPNPPGEQPQQP